MQFYGVDWLATLAGLTGVYMLGSKSRYGYLGHDGRERQLVCGRTADRKLGPVVRQCSFLFPACARMDSLAEQIELLIE